MRALVPGLECNPISRVHAYGRLNGRVLNAVNKQAATSHQDVSTVVDEESPSDVTSGHACTVCVVIPWQGLSAGREAKLCDDVEMLTDVFGV